MSIEIGTIQDGEIIKCQKDFYKIIDSKPKYDADGEQPRFLAQRFIKTRGTWAKQPHSLKFHNSYAEKF